MIDVGLKVSMEDEIGGGEVGGVTPAELVVDGLAEVDSTFDDERVVDA